jgi:hypothetical protein
VPAGALAAKRKPGSPKRPVCGLEVGVLGDEPIPTELPGMPSPAILAEFGVLRRAAQPGDAVPPLNPLGSQLGYELASYYPAAIRRVALLPGGAGVFLVLGFPRTFPIPAAHCLPPSLRAHRPQLVEQQHKRAAEPIYCVGDIGSQTGGGPTFGSQCRTIADIDRGTGLEQTQAVHGPRVGIVPDGVARVRIAYQEGTTIEAAVSENAFVFAPPHREADRLIAFLRHPPKELRELRHHPHHHLSARERRHYRELFFREFTRKLRRVQPKQILWLNAAGQVVRTITPGTRAHGLGGALIIT